MVKIATISNIEPRRDIHGEIIDAHDGCLEYFNGRYYLYGVRFKDGDGFGDTNRFVCYSSSDLMTWTPHGELVPQLNDAPRSFFQCFVKYNQQTGQYVLWYNIACRQNGVAVAASPEGPFVIVSDNVQLKHTNIGVGDINLFVDDDGSCYFVCCVKTSGSFEVQDEPIPHHMISVEKLTPDYLGTTGESSDFVAGNCEGPSMIKHNNLYYLVFDNTCCYCTDGTGVRVYTSRNPLGPFEYRGNINIASDTTRGLPTTWTWPGSGRPDTIIKAQGKHIANLPTPSGTAFIWIGDRWGSAPDGIKGHDFQYWSSPLQFEPDGMIKQLQWEDSWTLALV